MSVSLNLKKYANRIYYIIDAKEFDYLYIDTSQIPNSGMGLYTAISIYKDEIISVFKGETLTNSEAISRSSKGNNKYFMELPNGLILDTMHTNCFAKYANDVYGFVKSSFKTNSKISISEKGEVCIIAKKKINAGEEIFCKYGKAYWKKNQIV